MRDYGAEGGTCKERSDGIVSKQMRLVRASQIRHTALRTVKQKDLQSQVFLKLSMMNKKDFLIG